MRILHITPAYAPSIGGIEAVVRHLTIESARKGISADVAHVAPSLTYSERTGEGGTVWTFPLVGHRNIGLSPRLGQISRAYDVIHVHDPQVSALTVNARLSFPETPKVLSTHGGFRHTRARRVLKRLHELTSLRPLLRTYTVVLATSRSDLAYFGEYTDHAMLAENGVDIDRFSELTCATHRSPLRWIYWGRLSKNKRLDLAIQTVARAHAMGYPAHLTIAGTDFDGLTGGLTRYAADRGISSSVCIKPALSDSELRAEISRSGVFVTASEHEGFGLGVVEAMAAGLAVVCRDMPPLNDFVSHRRSGFFLRFDGSKGDDAVLHELLSIAEARQQEVQRAAAFSAASYSWSNRIDAFISGYRRALA